MCHKTEMLNPVFRCDLMQLLHPMIKRQNLVWVSGTFSSGLPGPKKSLQATFEKPTTPSFHELTPTPTGTSTQQPQGDSGAFWVAACSYFLPTSVQFKPSHLPGETFSPACKN